MEPVSLLTPEPHPRKGVATALAWAIELGCHFSISVLAAALAATTCLSAGAVATRDMSVLLFWPFLVLTIFVVGWPLAALFFPIFLLVGRLLRWRLTLRSYGIGASVVAAITYLVFIALGFGTTSERPMTFSANLRQPMRLLYGGIAVASGATGRSPVR